MSGMHLVRGMSSLSTKKRKGSNSKRLIAANEEHEAYLKRMGVGKFKLPTNKQGQRVGINDIPDYSVKRVTSDTIPAHGPAKAQSTYTGSEIAGIVTTHKSNLMPIRRDNKNAAKDAASMRRN
jgi:hypothetical protein